MRLLSQAGWPSVWPGSEAVGMLTRVWEATWGRAWWNEGV